MASFTTEVTISSILWPEEDVTDLLLVSEVEGDLRLDSSPVRITVPQRLDLNEGDRLILTVSV